MSRCLREYTLVMVYTGEGTEQQRTHLTTCQECSVQYQHLVRDWQRIEQILHTAPPQSTSARPSIVLRWRWLPAVATLVATLVVVWAGTRWWQPGSSVQVSNTPREEVVGFLETSVAPALFADTAVPVVVPPVPVSDVTYAQAALDGEWPCERESSSFTLSCEIRPFPLLIGG